MLKKNTKNFTKLRLANCGCGDAGAKAVAEMLETNSSVRILDFTHNEISGAGIRAIAQALKVWGEVPFVA